MKLLISAVITNSRAIVQLSLQICVLQRVHGSLLYPNQSVSQSVSEREGGFKGDLHIIHHIVACLCAGQ